MNNCNAAAKSSTVLDISKNKDDSVLSWVDNNTLYIGPAYSNKISVGVDASCIFAECYSVKRIEGLENLDMSECNYMDEMFRECQSLVDLDLSGMDLSNIISMKSTFSRCTKLDVSNFDTSNVEDMRAMFKMCRSLEQLDLSNFDTFIVHSMAGMFADCSNLKTLNLSGFSFKRVTSIYRMFANCRELTSLTLNIDKDNFNAFDGCNKLNVSLNISHN